MKFYFLAFTCIASICSAIAQPALDEHNAGNYLSALLDNGLRFDSVFEDANEIHHHAEPEASWKSWQTVQNFTYGKDRGNLPMIADLQSLHPYFRDKIVDLIKVCKAQGITLAVVESYRTPAKQAEYFSMGRKYTRSQGGKSKHQYGLAVDVVPMIDSVAVWDNTALWKKIGIAGEKLGLRWGGRWRAPYDPAHFEWSGGITTTQLAYGLQPSIPKSHAALYPCLDEEIKILQKCWEAWEIEQSVLARNPAPANTADAAGQTP